MNNSFESFSGSTGTISNFHTRSLPPPDDSYKDKYIQGLEERINLHQQIFQKDMQLKQAENMLNEAIAHASHLEQLLAKQNSNSSNAPPLISDENYNSNDSLPFDVPEPVSEHHAALNKSHATPLKPKNQFKEPEKPSLKKQSTKKSVYVAPIKQSATPTPHTPVRTSPPRSKASAKSVRSTQKSKHTTPTPNKPPQKILPPIIINPDKFVPLTNDLKASLVPWTEVIRSTHPGSLSHLKYQERIRIEQAFQDFLSLRISWKDIGLCYAADKNGKEFISIPEEWADSFSDWFALRIDHGLMDPFPKSKPRMNTSAFLFSVANEMSPETPILRSWLEIIRSLFPHFKSSSIHEDFVKDYLESQDVEAAPGSYELPEDYGYGVPIALEEHFLESFVDFFKFSPHPNKRKSFSKPVKLDKEPVTQTFTSSVEISKILMHGMEFYKWTDLIHDRFGDEYKFLIECKDAVTRITKGMTDFLSKNLPEKSPSDCLVSEWGKQYGIPWNLKADFEKWFEIHAENEFSDFSETPSSPENHHRKKAKVYISDQSDEELEVSDDESYSEIQEEDKSSEYSPKSVKTVELSPSTPSKTVGLEQPNLWSDAMVMPMQFTFEEKNDAVIYPETTNLLPISDKAEDGSICKDYFEKSLMEVIDSESHQEKEAIKTFMSGIDEDVMKMDDIITETKEGSADENICKEDVESFFRSDMEGSSEVDKIGSGEVSNAEIDSANQIGNTNEKDCNEQDESRVMSNESNREMDIRNVNDGME